MKVLVTGAAGFIGSRLAFMLAKRGDEVVGIDNINDYYDQRLKYSRLKECGITNEGAGELAWHQPIQSSIFVNYQFVRMSIDEKEAMNVLFRKEHFDKVIVVMNVGGMVDTSWFAEDDLISSVLFAFQGGMEGGTAAAELLLGEGNPSGKLSDTLAKSLQDYPSSESFHESRDYVDYVEDIYVGYRYFETIPGAREKVNYPFGFGLSYTTFEVKPLEAGENHGNIQVRVQVTNTGSCAGKEVVQIYVGKPQGKLGKPDKELVAFEKTRLLQTGESQLLLLQWKVSDMASFDDLGKPVKQSEFDERGKIAKKNVKFHAKSDKSTSNNSGADSSSSGFSEIEVKVLGMTVSEAIEAIEPYIISMNNENGAKILKIVHGKGTGALARGVQNYLKKNSLVSEFRYGRYGEGDNGVTFATIK
mgnify:CR=1 FL=1